MSIVQSITSLLSVTAWPAVALAALFLLRKPAQALIGRSDLRSLRFKLPGGAEAEAGWEVQLSEAKQGVTDAAIGNLDGNASDKTVSIQSSRDLLNLAQNYPEAAVMMSFQRMETALAELLHKHGYKSETFMRMLQTASEHNLLNKEIAHAADSLRDLRNKSVHGPSNAEVTVGRATQYVLLSAQLTSAIRSELQEPIDPPS